MSAMQQNTPSGLKKAATILTTLGGNVSAEILKHLSQEEVQLVSKAVAQLGDVSSSEAEIVVEEFEKMVIAQQYIVTGGLDYAQEMLQHAFGSEIAARLLDEVRGRIATEMANFDVLQAADPQQLATFIHAEHPQTIALILSHLTSAQAAALLKSLPREMRSDVVIRMANIDEISPEIIANIASALEQKLKAVKDFSRVSYGGVRSVAEMINQLDAGESRAMLDGIREEDENLSDSIRQLMFVFEDLMQLDIGDLREVVRHIDRKLLVIALKGASDEIKTQIMSVISERNAQMMREDLELMGPVKLREVEAAQQHVIDVIREMERKGSITLQPSQYVS